MGRVRRQLGGCTNKKGSNWEKGTQETFGCKNTSLHSWWLRFYGCIKYINLSNCTPKLAFWPHNMLETTIPGNQCWATLIIHNKFQFSFSFRNSLFHPLLSRWLILKFSPPADTDSYKQLYSLWSQKSTTD